MIGVEVLWFNVGPKLNSAGVCLIDSEKQGGSAATGSNCMERRVQCGIE